MTLSANSPGLMAPGFISPGFIALHSHRSELLAETVSAWLVRQPLAALEQEVVLVQSNGMAEWIKMTLAQQGGVCAATKVELPSRFLWRTYRQVLGAQQVPPDSPLDKLPMTWRLMALLPSCVDDEVFLPVTGFLRADASSGQASERLLQLASRLADLFDQYQIYRPDWLDDWAAGRDVLRQAHGAASGAVRGAAQAALPPDQLWQAHLWRRVLATLSDAERQATRPALHARAMARLQSGQALASPVARRVSVFGMSQMPSQLLEMLAALAVHSQVLLAVPNPCQYHWGDIMDGRDALRAERRRHADRDGKNLSNTPFEQMHLHAPALLVAWGRQGRDFIRQLDAFDDLQAAQERMPGLRLDLFEDEPGRDGTRLLAQLQNRIRDLKSAKEPVQAALQADDRSVVFTVAHSPVRELEVLHDQLLQWFHEQADVSPRDVVVMVPDIEQMAPAIRAVFGQYKRGDARFIPHDIADLGAQATSPLIHALQALLVLPQQRARMSDWTALLEVPALAARFGIGPEQLPTLSRFMVGSGIRWGLSAEHRAGLGLASCGDSNTALLGVQRMLMGYACGGDPVPHSAKARSASGLLPVQPYAEVGGLEAELAGALAHLLQTLLDWWQVCATEATPLQWAERGRTLLAAVFKPQSDADRQALSALDQALSDWVQAAQQADFAQAVPLSMARSAWLDALKLPQTEQRFRAGGVTFCTLMPMRAIPFKKLCLLGMNDGDYPRRSPRADFDLLGLPGMARPGDRSRQGDDRQLMLEALLSARRTLYVSWSGRSVRDNSEQPPSVLVSQLRDEIDALWGQGSAQRLTTVHPLQPFGRAYFAPESALQTYAREWRSAQQPPDTFSDPWPAPPSLDAQPIGERALLAPLQSASGQPTVTLAQLARFLRKPVGAFFRERLQVQLEDERTPVQDTELFGLGGLDLYQLIDRALAHVPVELEAHGVPEHVHQLVQGWGQAGAMPLAGVGAREAQKLTQLLQSVLLAGLRERAACGGDAERVLVDLSGEHAHLQDALGGLLRGPQGPLSLHWRASRVALIQDSGKALALPDKLIDVWLVSLAAAAMGQPLSCVVVGRNAVLHVPPQQTAPARAQLQVLLARWAEGMRWPLPLPPALALKWLEKKDSPHALLDLYEGDSHQRAERDQDPALARTYPTLDALLATGAFEALAQEVYAPLKAWADSAQVLALPEVSSEDVIEDVLEDAPQARQDAAVPTGGRA